MYLEQRGRTGGKGGRVKNRAGGELPFLALRLLPLLPLPFLVALILTLSQINLVTLTLTLMTLKNVLYVR